MSETLDLVRRVATTEDVIHARLKAAVEIEECRYLWTPADAIKFVPRVLDAVYGDGRALLRLSTTSQRPAYWIIRADSSWQLRESGAPDNAPEFVEFLDRILTDLEDYFGTGRCYYSGSTLFLPRKQRDGDCSCEDCQDEFTAEWPTVDDSGGWYWGRMNWPDGFPVEKHPWARGRNLLRDGE